MALEEINCPHCRQDRTMESTEWTPLTSDGAYFLFVCPSCSKPVVVLAEDEKRDIDYNYGSQVCQASLSFRRCGWKVIDTWPKAEFRRGDSPDGVPETIGAMFNQCQDVASRGGYDLAIMGFHRTLEMARKAHSPEFLAQSRMAGSCPS